MRYLSSPNYPLYTLYILLYMNGHVDPPQSPSWHVHPRFCLFSVSLRCPSLSLSLSAFVFLSSPFHLFHLFLFYHLVLLYISSLSLLLFIAHPCFSPSCPSSSHLLRPADYTSSLFFCLLFSSSFLFLYSYFYFYSSIIICYTRYLHPAVLFASSARCACLRLPLVI